jgi:EAL domain-containing protein (putative c-di-GMP-specific phosphodiesterase class I)
LALYLSAVQPEIYRAGKMIVSLDSVYCSHLYCRPAVRPDDSVMGVEIVANFVGASAPVRIPTELLIPHLAPEQHLELFREKLTLIEEHQHFFISRQLVVWVHINETIIDTLINNQDLYIRLKALPFIELTISESFPDLNSGKANLRLAWMVERFALVLADFGAGNATTKSLFDGMFRRVMMDRFFIQKQLSGRTFSPFMLAIIGQVSPFCESLLVAGIDSANARRKVQALGFAAMQGKLWPLVQTEDLASIFPPHEGLSH